MSMKKFWLAGVVGLLLSVLFVVGCAELAKPLNDTIQVTEQVQNEATGVLAVLEQEAAKLPPGPERAKIEEQIAKVKAFIVDTTAALEKAKAVAAALENGQVPPELTGALATVPYGVYIGFGISAIAAVMKTLQAGKTKDALTKVVQSWEAVGPELTPPEKQQAAAIQGPKVTALVHKVKKTLPKKAPPKA